MIRITKQADYAIILLGQFVTDGQQMSCNARDLSVTTKLPLPMVGKILKSLARSGLLVSQRGVKGGYKLARSPEGITVAEIIGAIDGPIGLTACGIHLGGCEHEPHCPARTNWNKINQAILGALGGITLLDMVQPWMPLLKPAFPPGRGLATPSSAEAPGRALETPSTADVPGWGREKHPNTDAPATPVPSLERLTKESA